MIKRYFASSRSFFDQLAGRPKWPKIAKIIKFYEAFDSLLAENI